LGIYVGYDSPSIIKYLDSSIGDLFTAQFVDSHFAESVFPTLGGERKKLEKDIGWNELSLSHLDNVVVDLIKLILLIHNNFSIVKKVVNKIVRVK